MSNLKTTALISAIALGLGLTAAQAGPRGDMGAQRPDFATLDADGNGAITPNEMAAHQQARFASMDTNGDGAISAEELSSAMMQRRAARMIARMDANGDGMLQADEMGGKRDPFATMDTDGDGTISAEEFAAHKPGANRGDAHGKRHCAQDGKGGRTGG